MPQLSQPGLHDEPDNGGSSLDTELRALETHSVVVTSPHSSQHLPATGPPRQKTRSNRHREEPWWVSRTPVFDVKQLWQVASYTFVYMRASISLQWAVRLTTGSEVRKACRIVPGTYPHETLDDTLMSGATSGGRRCSLLTWVLGHVLSRMSRVQTAHSAYRSHGCCSGRDGKCPRAGGR